MKQVVVIHGGDSFSTYGEYIAFLKEYVIESIEYFRKRQDWKATLQKELGDGYDVLLPQMPCKWNAKYAEWKVWFERLVPFLRDGVVLVGHSLGGSFLARYLSEEQLPMKISATLFVAAPYDSAGSEGVGDFAAPASLSLLAQQGGKIFLYYSKDDAMVSLHESERYQAALPSATARIFVDRGHFNQETFPELVSDIKSL